MDIKWSVINDEKRWLENGQNIVTKYWQLKYGQKRGQHLIKKSSHLFSKLAICGRLDSGQKMIKILIFAYVYKLAVQHTISI